MPRMLEQTWLLYKRLLFQDGEALNSAYLDPQVSSIKAKCRTSNVVTMDSKMANGMLVVDVIVFKFQVLIVMVLVVLELPLINQHIVP